MNRLPKFPVPLPNQGYPEPEIPPGEAGLTMCMIRLILEYARQQQQQQQQAANSTSTDSAAATAAAPPPPARGKIIRRTKEAQTVFVFTKD